jgi:hypothetical protein
MKGTMADYFTNLSFVLPLKDDQKAYALQLANTANSIKFGETESPPDFPDSLKQVLGDWQFETEVCDEGIWLHSESGGIDAVCAFVQHLLKKYDFAPFVSFEWSHDCSKPRTDAYGGGAAVITATEIKTMSTADWIISNLPMLHQKED